MLHSNDQNYHLSAPKTIKLSAGIRSEPVARTLKSNLVQYKDSISHNKNNDALPNRSVQLQRKEISQDHSNQKWDKVVMLNRQSNQAWNRQLQNQRQSLLSSSRDIKRISTELDQNTNRSKQKSMHLNSSQYKSPIFKKDQSQLTRTTHNFHNQIFSQERSSYQHQIQDLMNKVQYLENQCRNLRNQNQQLHRSMTAPKQLLQKQIQEKNTRIQDLQKRLNTKNRQHLDKCIQNQKNLAKITEFQGMIKKVQEDKQKTLKDLQKSNQYATQLSKQLLEAKGVSQNLQQQKKKSFLQLQGEKQKFVQLAQEKKLLQLQFDKISKLKDLVKEMEQSDNDKADAIKKHIAYQAQLIDLNGIIISNLQTHKHDLKINSEQQHMINKQIDTISNQIAVKIKDILEQKQKVQEQLIQARAQTERIRKTMFIGYQQIINKLKDQLIKLKQENVNLTNDSQSKIAIVKLEREIKLLQVKNQDIMKRNKQMEQIIQKLNNQHKKAISQINTQTSIRTPQYYTKVGAGANFESIIMNYQTRSLDLNERIHEKQQSQRQLKRKVQQLEGQIQQLRGQAQLSNRKQKCDNDNIKSKIQSMKMQLKSETDSLNRKIQLLQKNIQRKNKQIKQKDNFITHYLIQKVKGQSQVDQIVQEIDKFFEETR